MSEWSLLPIAETFHSLMGEGTYVGTPMHFVRLAGCNVGKVAAALKITDPFPILPSGKEAVACTSWDGRTFPCDTDYSKHKDLSVEDIIDDTWERHICITGGEPLLHYVKIENLFALANRKEIQVHVETSGTIIPPTLGNFHKLLMPGYWVTCSPKINAQSRMIRRANELKLLVDEGFNFDRLTLDMIQHPNVFLCAINDVDKVRNENVERCIILLKRFPNWRFSPQLHKIFGWR